MRRMSILALFLLLCGCDLDPGKLFDLIEGREEQVVILSRQPQEISSRTMSLVSEDPMKIIGQSTFVCFALRGDVTLTNAKEMEEAFGGLMGDAKVTINLLLKSGGRLSLGEPLQAWRMHGRILQRGEVSACATIARCKERWPVGAVVDKVEVSSEPSLNVMGIYWVSRRGPLEEVPVTSPSITSSADLQMTKTCDS
jgi:hypothetical protein